MSILPDPYSTHLSYAIKAIEGDTLHTVHPHEWKHYKWIHNDKMNIDEYEYNILILNTVH